MPEVIFEQISVSPKLKEIVVPRNGRFLPDPLLVFWGALDVFSHTRSRYYVQSKCSFDPSGYFIICF
jgi:hypothetical protein